MIVGFSSKVKQAALSSTRNVNSVCSPLSGGEEMRLESFGPLSLFDCGAHVVRLGTHASRSKRTWHPQKQPGHHRTNCTSPACRRIQKPALSALRKDGRVLEVKSTSPDVLSLSELCPRDLIDEYKLMVLLLHICHVFCWVTLVFATDSHIYSQE